MHKGGLRLKLNNTFGHLLTLVNTHREAKRERFKTQQSKGTSVVQLISRIDLIRLLSLVMTFTESGGFTCPN